MISAFGKMDPFTSGDLKYPHLCKEVQIIPVSLVALYIVYSIVHEVWGN